MRHRVVAFSTAPLIALVALGVSLAAFTGAGPSPTSTARLLCHDVLGGRALNSEPEKVSTVRQFGYGPADFHPAPNAFRTLGAIHTVAVCWTGTPNGGYELYAVTTGYKPVRIEGVTGVGLKSTPTPGFVDIP
jgi:hypothetical protein